MKINILNERLAEYRALLLQNPYIINGKQCLPPTSIDSLTFS